jgi:hypothetical protein
MAGLVIACRIVAARRVLEHCPGNGVRPDPADAPLGNMINDFLAATGRFLG